MANESELELVEENKIGIRKNKRRIFELEAGVSTTYAELMLLLADIEENRALLNRNFTSSFMGNRAIVVDNVNDLFNSRLIMIDSLDPKTDVESNFQTMFSNSVKIDQLENRTQLNEKLSEIIGRVQEVNVMLQAINTLVADANETIVEQVDTMISENAEWVDGELTKRMSSAAANVNKQGVSTNYERLNKLINNSDIAEGSAAAILKRVSAVTKSILESGKEDTNWKKAAYYRYWMHMAHHDNPAHLGMRTKRYKLIYFYGCNYQGEYQTPPGWELYDMKNDPQETKNLYGDPKHSELVKSLKVSLTKLRKKVGDDGSHYPKCEKIVQEFWDYDKTDQAKARKISNQFLAIRKAELKAGLKNPKTYGKP